MATKTFVTAENIEADDRIVPGEFDGEIIEMTLNDLPEGEVKVLFVDSDTFNVKIFLPDGEMVVTRETQFPINVEAGNVA